MAKEDYIQTNVILLCDKGTLPTPFVATPKKQNHHGITGGTIRDNLPLLNIFPFGVCTVTTYPCVPVMPVWEDYPESPWFIEGFQPLLMSSCAKCQLGGTIKIYPSLLAALAALGDNWKDKLLAIIDKGIGRALLGPVAPILEMSGHGDIVSSVGEFGRGFVVGFAKGLAGTVEGLYNMVAHPLDTLGGMAQLAGVAVVGYSNPIPGITAETRLKKFDSIFGTNLADVDAGIKQSLSDMGDQLVHGTNEERGEVVGQAVEFVAEFFVSTKGAGAALKVGKASSIGGKMSKMAKMAKLADKVADIVKATGSKLKQKTLGKLKDAFKGIFKKKNIARKTTNEESLMIQKLKEKYHLPNGKNIAKFEGEIDGKKIDMISISGKKSPAGTVKSVNFENQKLSTKATELDKKLNRKNLDVRAYDSEVKGLENILSKTTSESEGTIKIVSDRNMCTSCSDAITQFEQMRPNIKVEKVYVREYP